VEKVTATWVHVSLRSVNVPLNVVGLAKNADSAILAPTSMLATTWPPAVWTPSTVW
jgi:hypothetical protein